MNQMRVVPVYEKKKRGCECCKDMIHIREGKCFRIGCSHSVCPYHVLDGYKTYDEFLASEDSKILVDEFFATTASCYELAKPHSTKRLFSDGDERVGL